MNARSTNRPGGRGRVRKVRVKGGKPKGCVLILIALAAIPALLGALDVIWG